MGSYIVTSPSWNKLSISHLRRIIVPNGYNAVGVDRVILLGTDICLMVGVLGIAAVVKSSRRISGRCTLCPRGISPSNTLCCCTLWSDGGHSIDCRALTAVVRPNDCGRNGDIGGGSLSTVSKSSMISDNVSVGVIVGSSVVVGKKSTVLDCRFFLVVSISIL